MKKSPPRGIHRRKKKEKNGTTLGTMSEQRRTKIPGTVYTYVRTEYIAGWDFRQIFLKSLFCFSFLKWFELRIFPPCLPCPGLKTKSGVSFSNFPVCTPSHRRPSRNFCRLSFHTPPTALYSSTTTDKRRRATAPDEPPPQTCHHFLSNPHKSIIRTSQCFLLYVPLHHYKEPACLGTTKYRTDTVSIGPLVRKQALFIIKPQPRFCGQSTSKS